MEAILAYFRSSLEELRHVRWPTQQQAIRLSVIVIVFIVVNALFFGLVDLLLTLTVRFLLPSVGVST